MSVGKRMSGRRNALLGAVSAIAMVAFAAAPERARAQGEPSQQQFGPTGSPGDIWTGFSFGFGAGINHFDANASVYSRNWIFAHPGSVTVPTSYADFADFCSQGKIANAEAFCTFGDNRADLSTTGAFGTVELGYDVRHGNYVFGVYGDWSSGETGTAWRGYAIPRGTLVDDFKGATSSTLLDANLNFDDSYSIIGRFGHLVHEDVLVYGLFGWTWQEYEAQVGAWFDFEGKAGCCSPGTGEAHIWGAQSGTLDGPTLGLGVEALLHDNWTFKTEYRWTGLDGVDVSAVNWDGDCSFPKYSCETGGWAGFRTDDIDKHSIRGVLTLKFNGPE